MSGELLLHLTNCAILTVVVSLFVLWRYRVTVLEGMMRGGGGALPLPNLRPWVDPGAGADLRRLLQFEKTRQRDIAIAYGLTAFTCALPLALSRHYLMFMDSPLILPLWSVAAKMTFIYTFACVPMILASLALSRLRVLAGLSLLTALLTTLSIGAIALEGAARGFPRTWVLLTPLEFLSLAFGQMWMVALLWMAAWPRRLRAVAPITFAALLLFGFAPFIATRLTGNGLTGDEPARIALNTTFLLVALPTGGLAWLRLYQLAKSYNRKRFSDAQLLSRVWWLLLVCFVVLEMLKTPAPWAGVAAGAVSFLLFAPMNASLLSKTRSPRDVAVRTLLLLRVFGDSARTERLFDRIGARWRLFGPVTIIAAPDVVARTIGPGDYFRWLTGRTDEIFVTSRADLDVRLQAFDSEPDPDGRYRINAFCCRDNTWQATVVELMQRADAVLMDVRGFTAARHGSEFELQQLSQRLPPRRLVLVADRTTERTVLEEAFGPDLAKVRLVEMKSSRDHESVFEALLTAAA